MKYKAKRRMFALLCVVVIVASLTCSAFASSTAGTYLVNTDSGLYLRKAAGSSSTIICTLEKNTSVYYAGDDSEVADGLLWLHVTVTSGDYVGKSGWAANRYLLKIG